MIFISITSSQSIILLSFIACARPLAPQLPFVNKTVVVDWTVDTVATTKCCSQPGVVLNSQPGVPLVLSLLNTALDNSFLCQALSGLPTWEHRHGNTYVQPRQQLSRLNCLIGTHPKSCRSTNRGTSSNPSTASRCHASASFTLQ